jgi:hypothetical protein
VEQGCVIQPAYLAALRVELRCELLLTLVQVEQLCPGWWADLTELAVQLGTDRSTLNRSLTKLERLGMLRRTAISNSGGNWIWWVKRSPNEQPDPNLEPAWVLRDLLTRKHQRVTVSQRWRWAERHSIPRGTMQSFLGGYQLTLRGRWQLAGNPWQDESTDECAPHDQDSAKTAA